MKKYIVLIIAVLGLIIMPNIKAETVELPEVTDHEKVKVYLFRGAGCSHCYDFLTYFVDVYKDYEDYFEIVVYESWNDATNQTLMLDVKEKVGEEADGGVPFIVVGDDYHLLGFGENSGEEIINKALEEYQNDDYTDIVAKAIEDKGLNPNSETVAEAAKSEGIKVKTDGNDSKSSISDGVVVGVIFGVILLGFGGLVIISRKK